MLPLPGSSVRPSGGRPRILFPRPQTPNGHSFNIPALSSLKSRTRLLKVAAASISLFILALLLIQKLSSTRTISSHPKSFTATWRARNQPQVGWEAAATQEHYDSGIPLSMETTIERDDRYAQLDHLVMVPGHAIWIGRDKDRVEEDSEWVLQATQKGGSVRTFIKHIEEGVKVLKEDPKALLVFSGGATRAPPSPPLSEAYSYRALATTLDLLPSDPLPVDAAGETPLPLNLRAVTEEYALDSYLNLLFSVARFKEVTGRYPSRVTVVGYGMKRRRFTDLHRAAIGLPLDTWNYIGINDDGDTTAQYAGELKYGYTPFLSSPSGCHPPLSIKRVNRNPFFRYHPYHTSCPEMVELLEWCPARRDDVAEASEMQVFEGRVPWREKGELGLGWAREMW